LAIISTHFRILATFQQIEPFTIWVSALRGRLHGSGGRTGGLRRKRRAGSNARQQTLRAGTWLRSNSSE